MNDDKESEDEIKKLNTMPLHLGAFVLSNSKRNMNTFSHAKNGCYTIYVSYTETGSV